MAGCSIQLDTSRQEQGMFTFAKTCNGKVKTRITIFDNGNNTLDSQDIALVERGATLSDFSNIFSRYGFNKNSESQNGEQVGKRGLQTGKTYSLDSVYDNASKGKNSAATPAKQLVQTEIPALKTSPAPKPEQKNNGKRETKINFDGILNSFKNQFAAPKKAGKKPADTPTVKFLKDSVAGIKNHFRTIDDLSKKYTTSNQKVTKEDLLEVISEVVSTTEATAPDVLEKMKHEKFTRNVYDEDGRPTVGVGHRVSSLDAKKRTNEEIAAYLVEDIKEAKESLISLVGKDVEAKLTPGQRYALSDLLFNTGEGTLRKNPKLIECVRKGDFLGAIKHFDFIYAKNKDGKKVVYPGLCKRRIANILAFVEGRSKAEIAEAKRVINDIRKKGEEAIKNENVKVGYMQETSQLIARLD